MASRCALEVTILMGGIYRCPPACGRVSYVSMWGAHVVCAYALKSYHLYSFWAQTQLWAVPWGHSSHLSTG